MRITEAFPSEFLRPGDLQGREVTIAMAHVEMRELGGDVKPVLFFANKDRGLVLNKTNSSTIAARYGDETETWSGQLITLYATQVDFQGRRVEAIRVKIPQRPTAAAPLQQRQAPPLATGNGHADDGFPGDRPAAGGGAPLDEIPF